MGTTRPPASQTRGWRAGLIAGLLPQVVLLIVLMTWLFTTLDNREERGYLGFLVLWNVPIVPIAGVVAALCLIHPSSRLFGKGILAGTFIGASAFTVICVVVASN